MQTIPVVAAVIQRGGRYLICRRPLHKNHGGLWEFPGGKLEAGESVLAGMTRELREELGVQVEALGVELFAHIDPDSPFRIHFHDVAIDGEPAALEHSELAWLPVDELIQLSLAPTDRLFVNQVLRFRTS